MCYKSFVARVFEAIPLAHSAYLTALFFISTVKIQLKVHFYIVYFPNFA
jgi:hypothetical protein